MRPVEFDIYTSGSRDIGYDRVSQSHVQFPRKRTNCPGLYVSVEYAGETLWCLVHVGQGGKCWVDRERACRFGDMGWASS